MPYTCTKTSFPLFVYEQELRQTILPTFKEAVKLFNIILSKNVANNNHR